MAKEYNWDALLSTREWADVLKDIIADVDKAVREGSSEDRLSCADILDKFIEKSPPKCQSLDEIANDLISDLLIADMHAAAQAIASRNVALKKQIALINGVASDAKKSAEQLRLEPVISQMVKAKDVLETLKQEIEEKKEQGKELYGRVTGALAGIKSFLG